MANGEQTSLGTGLQNLMADLQKLVDEERERAADEVRERVQAAIHDDGNGGDAMKPSRQRAGTQNTAATSAQGATWLTRSEAAREFDVSMTHLMTLEKRGELKPRRKGRNVLLNRAQLEKAIVRAA